MWISLTSGTYARTSLATSPLAEVAISLRELAAVRGSPGLESWRRRAREAVQSLDLAPVRVLFTTRDFAEVLSPPPARSMPDFYEQLEELVAVPEERLARDVRRLYGRSVPAGAREYLRRPRFALERLASTLERYWAAAILPWWPRLSALLEQGTCCSGRRR